MKYYYNGVEQIDTEEASKIDFDKYQTAKFPDNCADCACENEQQHCEACPNNQ